MFISESCHDAKEGRVGESGGKVSVRKISKQSGSELKAFGISSIRLEQRQKAIPVKNFNTGQQLALKQPRPTKLL